MGSARLTSRNAVFSLDVTDRRYLPFYLSLIGIISGLNFRSVNESGTYVKRAIREDSRG